MQGPGKVPSQQALPIVGREAALVRLRRLVQLGLEASRAQTEAEVSRGARTIVAGFGLGLVYKLAEGAFKLWKDTPEMVFGAPLAKASLAAEISPRIASSAAAKAAPSS